MSTTVDVYVDYVCPFCFLAEGAIEELKRTRDVEARIHPFELRPAPAPTLRPEDDYLPRIWNASVYPMAKRVDVAVSVGLNKAEVEAVLDSDERRARYVADQDYAVKTLGITSS